MPKQNTNGNWKDRVHEVVWEDSLLTTAHKHVNGSLKNGLDNLINTIADGPAVRVRYVDRYNCYTVSINLPKDYRFHGGHTFWFYWGDLAEGLALAHWLLQEYLEFVEVGGVPFDRQLTF